MKKCYNLLVPLLFGYGINAQVGINTDSPKSTLDVQVSTTANYPDGIIPPRITADALKAKEAAYGADQNGAIVYVTSAVTPTGAIKTINVNRPGFYVYNNSFVNPNTTITGTWNAIQLADPTGGNGMASSVYSAKFNGNFSILGLTILGPTQQNIAFPQVSNANYTVEITSPQMTNGTYTASTAGNYQVSFSYQEGSGIKVGLLNGNSGLYISKTTATTPSTTTFISEKSFGGVNLAGLASVSITQTHVNYVFKLNAGDKLNFGFNKALLDLSLLTNVTAELSIYKIN